MRWKWWGAIGQGVITVRLGELILKNRTIKQRIICFRIGARSRRPQQPPRLPRVFFGVTWCVMLWVRVTGSPSVVFWVRVNGGLIVQRFIHWARVIPITPNKRFPNHYANAEGKRFTCCGNSSIPTNVLTEVCVGDGHDDGKVYLSLLQSIYELKRTT